MRWNLVFWILLIWFAIKTVQSMTRRPVRDDRDEVRGRRKNEPLDLSRSDVQDARFEDIDEKKEAGKK
jgi:hypothetical protein